MAVTAALDLFLNYLIKLCMKSPPDGWRKQPKSNIKPGSLVSKSTASTRVTQCHRST